MDNNKNKYGAYQNASHTVNEIQQVVMLYEGAIKFIKQAKEAINEKNHQEVYNLIHKAVNIISGLNSCLDFNEATDETAKALDKFYQDIDIRLLYIICDHNLDSCDRVIEDLKFMMDAWRDVEKTINGNDNLEIPQKNNYNISEEQETKQANSPTQEEQAKNIINQLENIELDI